MTVPAVATPPTAREDFIARFGELDELAYLKSIYASLRRLEDKETPPMEPPAVHVEPPDLTEIVTAVLSLRPSATAEEIGQAVARQLVPAPPGAGVRVDEVLGSIKEAFEKLDFRLQGLGRMYGAGPSQVSITPGSNLGIAGEVEVKNDVGSPLSVSGTVSATQGTSPWVVDGTFTPADGAGNTGIAVPAEAFLMGWNESSWDRLRTTGNNASGVTPLTLGVVQSDGFLYGLNPSSGKWDRLFAASDASDGIATNPQGNLVTNGHLYGWNGATWDRLRSSTANGLETKVTNTVTVTDDNVGFEAQHLTLSASTDTTVTFAQQVRVVRISNWDTANRVLVKNAAIASDGDTAATRIGKAPAADVPGEDYFPYKTTTIHLRSASTSEVSVIGFF